MEWLPYDPSKRSTWSNGSKYPGILGCTWGNGSKYPGILICTWGIGSKYPGILRENIKFSPKLSNCVYPA